MGKILYKLFCLVMVFFCASCTQKNEPVDLSIKVANYIQEDQIDALLALLQDDPSLANKNFLGKRGHDWNIINEPLHQNLWVNSGSGNFPS